MQTQHKHTILFYEMWEPVNFFPKFSINGNFHLGKLDIRGEQGVSTTCVVVSTREPPHRYQLHYTVTNTEGKV